MTVISCDATEDAREWIVQAQQARAQTTADIARSSVLQSSSTYSEVWHDDSDISTYSDVWHDDSDISTYSDVWHDDSDMSTYSDV